LGNTVSTTDGNVTLLSFLIETALAKYPEIGNWIDELKEVRPATKVPLIYMKECVYDWKNRFDLMKLELKSLDQSEIKFQTPLKNFLENATPKFSEISLQLKALQESSYRFLASLEATDMELEEVFSTIYDLGLQFKEYQTQTKENKELVNTRSYNGKSNAYIKGNNLKDLDFATQRKIITDEFFQKMKEKNRLKYDASPAPEVHSSLEVQR